MSYEEQKKLMRKLKGAPLSVLVALQQAEEGQTAVALERATGWSDKPVRQALVALKGMGLVRHQGRARGWKISRKGRAALRALLAPGGANGERGKRRADLAKGNGAAGEEVSTAAGQNGDKAAQIGNSAGLVNGNNCGSVL